MGHDDHDNFSPDLGLACREAGHAKATGVDLILSSFEEIRNAA